MEVEVEVVEVRPVNPYMRESLEKVKGRTSTTSTLLYTIKSI